MVKRSREKDEYPEWIRTQMDLILLDPGVQNRGVSAVQLQDWVLPVEINLNHPMFIELNSLTCWIDADDIPKAQVSVTAAAGSIQLDRAVQIYILNERRTAVPTLSDNAIIAHFTLNHRVAWASTTAAAANVATLDVAHSVLRGHREYEDMKTGMGLLISQPRIFLLVTEIDTQGVTEVAHADQTQVGFKMTFRLTDRVTAREFMTQMIASVS